jgi:hypothetical protein
MTTEALRILAFAALTLSVRVLTWIALIGGMALFGYAVLYPNQDRTFAAALFAVLIFIPALWSEKREKRAQPAPQQPRYREDSEAA